MKKVQIKKGGRDKAFLGAIVGQVAGIAGGIISAKKKKKAEELAFKTNQTEQVRLDGVNQAAVMNTVYSNQEYVDDYMNKVSLKAGGKVKINKGDPNDRIAKSKKFALGGRKKKEMGSLIGEDGLAGEAADAIGGVGGLVTSLFTKPSIPKTIKKADGFTYNAPKTQLAANSYQTDANGLPVNNVSSINGNVVLNDDTNLLTKPNRLARMGKLSKRSINSGL